MNDKSLSGDSENQSLECTPEIVKILEDSADGLVTEHVDNGKTIIKAGRLVRLVERLADHNAAGKAVTMPTELIQKILIIEASFCSHTILSRRRWTFWRCLSSVTISLHRMG